MTYKLKAWPNGMGFDFGPWELIKPETCCGRFGWIARRFDRSSNKPDAELLRVGYGATYAEAMANAVSVGD